MAKTGDVTGPRGVPEFPKGEEPNEVTHAKSAAGRTWMITGFTRIEGRFTDVKDLKMPIAQADAIAGTDNAVRGAWNITGYSDLSGGRVKAGPPAA